MQHIIPKEANDLSITIQQNYSLEGKLSKLIKLLKVD